PDATSAASPGRARHRPATNVTPGPVAPASDWRRVARRSIRDGARARCRRSVEVVRRVGFRRRCVHPGTLRLHPRGSVRGGEVWGGGADLLAHVVADLLEDVVQVCAIVLLEAGAP